MTPIQKRAQMLIHGGSVRVMPPRRLPRARRRWFRHLWTATWATAAVALLVAGMWCALALLAVVAQ